MVEPEIVFSEHSLKISLSKHPKDRTSKDWAIINEHLSSSVKTAIKEMKEEKREDDCD